MSTSAPSTPTWRRNSRYCSAEPKAGGFDCADPGNTNEDLALEGCERDENLRFVLGGTMEINLSRHWNFFGNFRGVLIGGDRYAYDNILFLENEDGGLYFKAGLTYKF